MKNSEAKILDIVLKTLDENKAEDIVRVDLNGISSIASEMVVASGTSGRHVAALAEKVLENLKKEGFKATAEGAEKADWILIDAFDVIVHLFKPEVRAFYNIEKMWQSAASLRK